MAVDKKSQHVGNHGGRYTDLDGMTKQFTYIDHDKKTSIATGLIERDPDFSMSEYRERLIKRITEVHASLCPTEFYDFTIRGDKTTKEIEWNIDMLIDNGMPINRLSELAVLLENRAELTGKIIKTY